VVDAYHALAQQARIVPGDHLHTICRQPGTVIFEGAQGVLLDEWRGFHPHTTWSTTTLANAERLLREADYGGPVSRIGITRAYSTRHGAGPFVSADPALTAALPDACNGDHAWQQRFRAGWLDLVLLRYACAVAGRLDTLAVTCLDRVAEVPQLYLCAAYQAGTERVTALSPSPHPEDLAYQEQLTSLLARCTPLLEPVNGPAELLERLTRELALPIGIVSTGPTAAAKRWYAPAP
jgi:adenylosuccinate synthase